MRRMAFCGGMSLMAAVTCFRDGNHFAAIVLVLSTIACTYLTIALGRIQVRP